MTPAQLEQQSRDAVIAYLQDSSVKLEVRNKEYEGWFMLNVNAFDLGKAYYRIAHPRSWYRVALTSSGRVEVVQHRDAELVLENARMFIKWLTERIPYDN